MEIWKSNKCGDCSFAVEAPRPKGQPIDLKAPKIYLCRESPPNIVYAIGQAPNSSVPQPMPLGSIYPMVDAHFPACSKFKAKGAVSLALGEETV